MLQGVLDKDQGMIHHIPDGKREMKEAPSSQKPQLQMKAQLLETVSTSTRQTELRSQNRT